MTEFPYITKTDFPDYAQMTSNIESRFITNAVNDAYNFDTLPVLPDTMLANIVTYLAAATTWSAVTAYVVGNKVVSGGRYYTCLINNTNSIPTSSNANWSETELMAFYVDYIKPYIVMSAYSRFLFWHGANVTQFGLRQNNEETSVEVSDKRRAELLQDIKAKINIYLSNLNKEFDDVSGVFDGTTYTIDTYDNNEPTRTGAQIWGVGYPNKNKVKCPDDYPFNCQ